jgi:hypothetical protein
VFRSGETCPEAGSNRALPSDKPWALPPENVFSLNYVRVRGQADPYTQHKRNGVPLWALDEGCGQGSLATPDPLEAEDRPGRKSRRTLRYRPGGGQPYLRALDDRFQPGVPPPTTLGAPWGRGCPLPPQKHGRSCTRTSSTLQHHSLLQRL